MANLATMGTTFNLPNYNGQLYGLTPADTPFVSLIGAFSGGGDFVRSKEWEWQTYTLRAPVGHAGHLEGQEAPAGVRRVRSNASNITQIFHSRIGVSYTKLAASAQRDGLAHVQGSATAGANELDWQIEQELKALKRDMEVAFLNNTYVKDTDSTISRRTRGILPAITTNVVEMPDADPAVAGLQPSYLTENAVLNLMQKTYDNGGIEEEETRTLMCNSGVRRQLTKIFITDKGYDEESRNVAGVSVKTIETDFGRCNIVLNRHMPKDQLGLFSLEQVKPMFMLIPGKGFLFLEPLAKTGASDEVQLYGEVGLEYGSELEHGKITNIRTDAV